MKRNNRKPPEPPEPPNNNSNEDSTVPGAQLPLHFGGDTYDPQHDEERLTGQLHRVWNVMHDSHWRTLQELSHATNHNDPEASVSARLRDLRKPKFGSHTVLRRPRGDRALGLWEYRLIPNDGTPLEDPHGDSIGDPSPVRPRRPLPAHALPQHQE